MKIFYLIYFLMIAAAVYAAPTKIYDDNIESPATNTTAELLKIRQCTCKEADDCITEVYPSLKECRKSCKSHLEYFGKDTDGYVECWPKNPEGKNLLATCLKTNIPEFCDASNSTDPIFIDQPEYNQTAIEEDESNPLEMAKHFKKFHYCAGACLKEKIVACYQRKSCGVTIPPNYDIGKPANFCSDLKSTVYMNTVKAFACITFSSLFG